MQNAVVPFVIFDLTHSGRWVGLSLLAFQLPGFFVGPWSGYLPHRYSARRVLLLTQPLLALQAGALWLVWTAGSRSLGLILGLVLFRGVVFGLGLAAWNGMVHSLVPREDLPSAVRLNSLQFQGTRAVGPALGGLALLWGPSWAFGLSALALVPVIAAVAALPTVAPVNARDHGGVARGFRDAVEYAWRCRPLYMGLLALATVGFLGQPIIPMTTVIARRVYAVGAGSYGLLVSAIGVGAILMAIGCGTVFKRFRPSQFIGRGLAALTLSFAWISLAPGLAWGMPGFALAGASVFAVSSQVLTSIYMAPDAFRNRLLALYVMTLTGTSSFGAVTQGWLSDLVDVRVVLGTAGAAIAIGASTMFRPTRLTDLDSHVGTGAQQ